MHEERQVDATPCHMPGMLCALGTPMSSKSKSIRSVLAAMGLATAAAGGTACIGNPAPAPLDGGNPALDAGSDAGPMDASDPLTDAGPPGDAGAADGGPDDGGDGDASTSDAGDGG